MGTRTLALLAAIAVAAGAFLLLRTPDPATEGDAARRSSAVTRTSRTGDAPGRVDADADALASGLDAPGTAKEREAVSIDAGPSARCRVEPLDGRPVRVGDECQVDVVVRRAGRSHRLEVRDDGTFDLPQGLGGPTARFALRSRYLRLEDQPDADEANGLVLRPARTGCLLINPVGAPAALAALDLTTASQSIQVVPLTRPITPALPEAHVDGEGRIIAGGLPGGVVWSLRFTSDAHVDAVVEVPMVTVGETTAVDLPLDQGVRVAGAVVDGDGDPVAGAAVRLRSWRYHDESLTVGTGVEGTTGPDGEFDLGGLRPGPVTVIVEEEGYLRAEVDLGEQESGAHLEDTRIALEGGLSLTGIVVWPDGEPAAGARVRYRTVGARFRKDDEVLSGEDGRFEIAGLTGGAYELHGSGRRKRETLVTTARAVAGAGELRLELLAGARFTGRVVDDRGEAVARARVAARPLGLASGLARVNGRADGGDGTFELSGLTPGVWEVSATAKDHGRGLPLRVDVPGGGGGLTLTLPRHGALAGFLQTDGGAAVPGATVAVGRRSVTTGPDGAFALEDLRPGVQPLRVDADGFGQPLGPPIVLAPGESREGEVVVVSSGASVVGTIHPAARTGSEAEVALRRDGTFSSQDATVAEDGSFRFDGVGAGSYWASIVKSSSDFVENQRAARMVPVEVPASGTVEVILGDPAAYPIEVRGVVTDLGEPQKGLLLYVYRAGGPGVFPDAMTRTNEQGRYDVRLREPGTYVLSVGRGQTEQTRHFIEVTDAPEQTFDFELPRHVLRGRLVRANGDPVARENIILVHEDADPNSIRLGDLIFAWTRADGRFVFEGIPEGRYRLRTGHYTRPDEGKALAIRGGIVVPWPEGAPELEVVLPDGAVVDVTAVRGSGGAYPEGRIRLQDARGYMAVLYDQRRPEADGTQRFVGIGPGPWTAVVEGPDGVEVGRTTVDVSEGEDVRVTVRCDVE